MASSVGIFASVKCGIEFIAYGGSTRSLVIIILAKIKPLYDQWGSYLIAGNQKNHN